MAPTWYSVLCTQYSVLGTKYSAFSTQCALIAFALLIAMVGCTPAQSLPAPAEHSFGAQLLSVRNGATDQIHVSASPLTDNDFTHLPSAA
jgi:hypothetical protein